MSTEHQKYSITNQLSAITQYAVLHDIDIATVYEDDGKSGLTLKGRPALRRLFGDMAKEGRDFDRILVYDISRWGRFQDTDESAHYEFQCRQHGVEVVYCEEPFVNDGSPLSAIWKNMKRAMAAEFSREYSAKVLVTLCEMARRGYFTGGRTIYGFERAAVAEDGAVRGKLLRGHRKSVRADHVVLQPGAKDQVKVVRKVFHLYADEGWSCLRIAAYLNKLKIPSLQRRRWHPGTIRYMLNNEKYVGVAHYNRTTRKLQTPVQLNDARGWIRTPGAYKPIVSKALFARAQAMRKEKAKRKPTEWMLTQLRRYANAKAPGERAKARAVMSSRAAYAYRFGSMRNAFNVIGSSDPPTYHVYELGQQRMEKRREILEELSGRILRSGGRMTFDMTRHLLIVDDRWCGRFDLLWNYYASQGQPRWRIRFWDNRDADPDFYLVGRMLSGTDAPVDYYLIPSWEVGRGSWRSSASNGELDVYRHKSLASVAACLVGSEALKKRRTSKQLLGLDHPSGGRPRKHLAPAP
jgi:DNA invertase Pin-like site-specific DNA recombinase